MNGPALRLLRRFSPADFRAFTLLEVIISSALTIMLLALIFSFLVPTLHVSSKTETRMEMEERAMVALARIAQDLGRSTEAGLSLCDASLARSASPLSMLPETPAVTPTAVTLVIQGLPEPPLPGCCSTRAIVGCHQQWSTDLIAYTWDKTTMNLHRKEYNGQGAFSGLTVCPACPPITVGVITSDFPNRLLSSEVCQIAAAQMDIDPLVKQDDIIAHNVIFFVVTMADWGPCGPAPPAAGCPNGVGYVQQPLNVQIGMSERTANGARTPESLSIQRWVSTRNGYDRKPCP